MKLVRRDFRAWLESQEPHETVGRKDNIYHCPLAEYIHKLNPQTVPSVTAMGYRLDRSAPPRRSLPKWARTFVENIDRSDHRYISAQEALEILDR